MRRLILRKDLLLLSFSLILFTLSAGYSFYKLNRASETIAEQYPLTVWLLNRTELEFTQLLHSLELYNAGARSSAKVQLDFDILWNRAEIILDSKEAYYARSNLEIAPLILGLLTEMKALDPQVQALPEYSSLADAKEIHSRLLKFKPALQALHQRSFHQRESLYDLGHFSNALGATGLAVAGLLISGLLLIGLLIRQYQFSRYQASHDALSGLANRRTFIEFLNLMLQKADKNGVSFAVYLIDLDNFKQINDCHGHLVGDNLIQLVSERLQHCLRTDDIAARLGGDEFALIQYPLKNTTDSDTLQARLRKQLSFPVGIGEHNQSIGFSIGISYFPQDGDTAEALLHQADIRMYQEKAAHRAASKTAHADAATTFTQS